LSALSRSQPELRVNSDDFENPEAVVETDETVEIHVREDDIWDVWRRFVDSLSENSSRMYSALRNQQPVFESDRGCITLHFRNKALIAEFRENYKAIFTGLLNEQLKDVRLVIEEKVIESDEAPQTKYYTDQDKLKFMIEKNPALGKLKQEFSLDFE